MPSPSSVANQVYIYIYTHTDIPIMHMNQISICILRWLRNQKLGAIGMAHPTSDVAGTGNKMDTAEIVANSVKDQEIF